MAKLHLFPLLFLSLAITCVLSQETPAPAERIVCTEGQVSSWQERQRTCEKEAEEILHNRLLFAFFREGQLGEVTAVACQLLRIKMACVRSTELPPCMDPIKTMDEIRLKFLSSTLNIFVDEFSLGASLSENCPTAKEANDKLLAMLTDGSGECDLKRYTGALLQRRDCIDEALKEKDGKLDMLKIFPTARSILTRANCVSKSRITSRCRQMIMPCLNPEQQADLIAKEEIMFAKLEEEVRDKFDEPGFSFEESC